MDEEEIIKKCKGIDKAKEDLSIVEKFEQIYSHFMISKRSPRIPKIIKDEESLIISNRNNNEEEISLDEKNLYNKKYADYLVRKPSKELNKINDNQVHEDSFENEDNKKNKIIKNLIQQSKELISKKILDNEIKQINKIKINSDFFKEKGKNEDSKNIIELDNKNEATKREKKKKIQNIIEKMKQNKQKYRKSKEKINIEKVNNYKNNKNIIRNKSKKSMKDIYKHIYGILDDDISLNSDKKYNIKNAYQRLYNQGFYIKNKSQINILDNINQIKKESNHNKILKKSKELLGLSKKSQSKKNKIVKKYDKNNIYKPIKSKIPNNNDELSFRPELNENTIKIAEKLEEPFIRLTRPKSRPKQVSSKKLFNKKEVYEKCIKRVNYLYLEGVEKLKKKRKLKSCPPTEITDENDLEIKNKNNDVSLKSKKLKSSRNTYYKQIQWKKKIIFENIKMKKICDYYDNSECTFKPEITKSNLKKIFKKHLSETDIKIKKTKSYLDIYNDPKLNKFSISKQRYFIINNNDINKNKTKVSIYYKKEKDKLVESEKRYKYNEKNIKLGLIKRKLYNLEKFFSKQKL